jgi:hypothetical protein
MNREEFNDEVYRILHTEGGVQTDLLDDITDRMINLLEKVRFTSEIGNGVVVAWDTCYTCKKHYLRCSCGPSGPTEPVYIAGWRREWLKEREEEAHKAADRQAEKERILAERVRTAGGIGVLEELGDEGQDRESYTDDQDRESYTVDNGLDAALAAVSSEQEPKEAPHDDPGF